MLFFKVLLGVAISLFTNHALATSPLPSYHAEYTVYWKGIVAGTSKQSFYQTAPRHYHAKTHTYPILPLLPFEYVEENEFIFQGSQFRPLHFTYQYQEHRGTRKGQLDFHWKTQKAIHKPERRVFTLPSQNIHDKITYLFQLRFDIKTKRKHSSYKICTEKGLKNLQFVSKGREILNTPLGKIKTVIFEQKDLKRKRHSVLWLAETFDYLPIKLQQFRKGQLTFEAVLKSYHSN